jgi:hypothetical protein
MFILIGLAVLLGAFVVIFGLWFVIWSFTMSGPDVMQTMIEEKQASANR